MDQSLPRGVASPSGVAFLSHAEALSRTRGQDLQPVPRPASVDGGKTQKETRPDAVKPGAAASLQVERPLRAADPIGGVVPVAGDREPVAVQPGAEHVGGAVVGPPRALDVQRLPASFLS